jgi:hypothetical protein
VIDQKNKRRFPRISLRAPIRYQVRGRPEFDHAICDNISVGGLCFTGEQFIPTSTTLMLEINLLSRFLQPVGRIAWSQSLPHSDRKRLGIEFLELNNVEKNYLSDYVDMQLNHSMRKEI